MDWNLSSKILLHFIFILHKIDVIHFLFHVDFYQKPFKIVWLSITSSNFLFKWIPLELQVNRGLILTWLMYERSIRICKCYNILVTWLPLPFRVSSFKSISQIKTLFVFLVPLLAMSIMLFVISFLFLLLLKLCLCRWWCHLGFVYRLT